MGNMGIIISVVMESTGVTGDDMPDFALKPGIVDTAP
jgi:hypothetical protein